MKFTDENTPLDLLSFCYFQQQQGNEKKIDRKTHASASLGFADNTGEVDLLILLLRSFLGWPAKQELKHIFTFPETEVPTLNFTDM